ncbi:MAG: hypothetical protein JXA51_00990 [Dehalococcoidales bacterium]|nr:hypothetical protein [Dehalococcoidales bacterium]
MRKKPREVFLANLLSDLVSQYPDWQIKDHCRIEIDRQPGNLWPQADILISMPGRRFIIEYDEDSDPGRSLVKYWPVLDDSRYAITIIEVWKGGQTVGRGYATLAKWMGTRLMKLYPGTIYEFIERTDEPSEQITGRIARMILGREKLLSE